MKYNLSNLVRQVQENNPKLQGLDTVIEKEILHYDILSALHEGKFLNELTFCGGTALRLCHGPPRLSEDLDFEGGPNFTVERMKGIETCIKDFLGSRYGLETIVRTPKKRSGVFNINVST